MKDLQLELTRLIGQKDLSFGCIIKINGYGESDFKFITKDQGIIEYIDGDYTNKTIEDIEIIGHPAQLPDLHRWMKINKSELNKKTILEYAHSSITKIYEDFFKIPYDHCEELINQSEYTLEEIIELIKKYS